MSDRDGPAPEQDSGPASDLLRTTESSAPGRVNGEFRLPPGRIEERFTDHKPRYTQAEAVAEANRCLYCADAPCIAACPTAIDIPSFIRKIATGSIKGSARTILDANILGLSCAMVCPVEVLCAGACVYVRWGRDPIRIGRLQRFAVEEALQDDPKLLAARPSTGRKIAFVGAGPASLAAAGWLALEGHSCTIFERKSLPGGLNTLGVAPYKMKGADALREIEWLLGLGDIELRTGVEVEESAGQDSGGGQPDGGRPVGKAVADRISATELLANYDAVFLGLGLGADSLLRIPGEDGEGVIGATALIERMKADPSIDLSHVRRAVVIGGGNTALDVLHELPLLGIETTLVYRRSREEMPGYLHELNAARLHGGRLIEGCVPVEIVRGAGAKDRGAGGSAARDPGTAGSVLGVRIVPAAGGRPVSGAEPEFLPVDLVVVAIGQNRVTRLALAFPGVRLDERGGVVVDPATYRTGHPRVWAGGDCVNGGKEVVNAAAEAKVAARAIHAALADGSLDRGPRAEG